MPRYYVECVWMECGHISVEADTPEEAKRKVIEMQDLPIDAKYIEESFRVTDVQGVN